MDKPRFWKLLENVCWNDTEIDGIIWIIYNVYAHFTPHI